MTTEPDPHAVPGLEPADGRTRPLDMSRDPDRFDPDEHPRLVEPAPTGRLDVSQDPDRYDPSQDTGPAAPVTPRGLDPAQDPDRFLPPGQGQTLNDLIGASRTYEGDRDGYQWIAGLLGVVAFLALVAFLFNSVLTP